MRRTIMAASALAVAVFCLFSVSLSHADVGSFSFGSASNPDLNFMPIPEPGALVSLIGGAAVLIGIQRFRRRG